MDSMVALQTEVSNLKNKFGGKEAKWNARPGSEGDPKFKEVPKDKRWITEPSRMVKVRQRRYSERSIIGVPVMELRTSPSGCAMNRPVATG